MTERTAPDWERIEAQYRAGTMSTREIAAQHGITEGAIRKRARRDGWERDITRKVEARVRRDLVRTDGTQKIDPRTEAEEIKIAAATRVEIVRGHRTYARKALAIVDTLAEQLEAAVGNRDVFQGAIEELKRTDAIDAQRMNALMRIVSLPTHIVAAKDLGMAMRNFVNLERQAFGMAETDDPAPPETPKDENPTLEAIAAAHKRQRDRLTLKNGTPDPPG